MDMHFRKIPIEFRALLCLSMFLPVFALCNAHAQTPAPSQPAPASPSLPAVKPQPATGSASEQPLPKIDQLIQQVRAQQKASWKTIQQYTYRMSNSEQDFDSHGAAKKTTSKELETFCVVKVGCFTRLLTVDGKPLSDDAMKRQNEVIDSEIAWGREWKEKKAAGLPPPPPLQIKKSDEVGDDNSEFAYDVGSFLQWGQQLGTFSNLRRVEFHGRKTIVMDYVGNPHAKSPNLRFGIFRDLALTFWVDEQDRALVRVEGHVMDNYKVGGGLLADVHKGATLQMEWTRVNNEVWLPATFSGRGSARIVVFAYHSEALDQRWSDYRKFRTSSTILPGVAPVETQATPGGPAKL